MTRWALSRVTKLGPVRIRSPPPAIVPASTYFVISTTER
jgi:hypothetical protein